MIVPVRAARRAGYGGVPPHRGTQAVAGGRPAPRRGTRRLGRDNWFDVIPLSDARTALVVGDVVRHGVNAAANTGAPLGAAAARAAARGMQEPRASGVELEAEDELFGAAPKALPPTPSRRPDRRPPSRHPPPGLRSRARTVAGPAGRLDGRTRHWAGSSPSTAAGDRRRRAVDRPRRRSRTGVRRPPDQRRSERQAARPGSMADHARTPRAVQSTRRRSPTIPSVVRRSVTLRKTQPAAVRHGALIVARLLG